jgi:hypothetical protein
MSRRAIAIRQFIMVSLALFAFLYALAFVHGCGAAQNKVVAQDVLSASQILCVLASNLIDDKAVADACEIDQALIPIIRPLLAVKEARGTCGPVVRLVLEPIGEAGAQ